MGKTSEPPDSKKTGAWRTGGCPACRTRISDQQVLVDGMIHARSERAGGPFHTILCPGCQVRLVAERMGGSLAFADESALPQGSKLLRSLRTFLGMPKRPGGVASDPRVVPRLGRPAETGPSSPRPQKRPGPGARFEKELRVLGLGPDCSLSDVKRCYRVLVKEYHPDLAKTRSGRERAVAKRRFLAVQSAYEAISSGWSPR